MPVTQSGRLNPSAPGLRLYAGLLLGLLVLTLLWDWAGQDLAWSQWFGSKAGFPLKNDRLLQFWFHDVAQNAARVLFFGCITMIWLPLGVFKSLPKADRVHLVLATLLATLTVLVFKQMSKSSCPWSLADFGGAAQYVSHWQWGMRDGGGGRCFPGGHSSAGFAFVAGSFWLAAASPRVSMWAWWLAGAAGMALGWVQVLRGAHFFSHALWAWVLCAVVGLAYYAVVQTLRTRRKPSV